MTRVYLPELGIVNALGGDRAAVLDGLLAGRTDGLVAHGPLLSGRMTAIAPVRAPLPDVPGALREFDCRNNRLVLAALRQIEDAVRACVSRVGPHRIAVVMGTSTSGIADGERAVAEWASSGATPAWYHYRQQEAGTLSEFVARYLGVSGPRYTISTACSSSAKVFGAARRLIGGGHADAAIIGGCDTLCRLTVEGFDALESLAAGRCNPFSANRDGINIGEGAAVFLMTREPAPVALLGTGDSSDGYHMSAPEPGGRGATSAIRAALLDAGMEPADVGYINLHGTATRQNDAMESRVIAATFGAGVPCSSTKGQIGHTLGAAGAQETGLCWLLLNQPDGGRALPPHQWDGAIDTELAVIGLTKPGDTFARPAMMSNSFAFGGSNSSVIIGRARWT